MTFLEVLPPIGERRFMQQVTDYAEMMGWRWYHTQRSEKSPRGFPDLVLVRRPRVVFAELKADRTPLTNDQRDWIEDLNECGQEVYVWRPSRWPQIEQVLGR